MQPFVLKYFRLVQKEQKANEKKFFMEVQLTYNVMLVVGIDSTILFLLLLFIYLISTCSVEPKSMNLRSRVAHSSN